MLYTYLGRTFTEAWLGAGWMDTLEIPQSFNSLSGTNEGAESELSAPVNATPHLAAAA